MAATPSTSKPIPNTRNQPQYCTISHHFVRDLHGNSLNVAHCLISFASRQWRNRFTEHSTTSHIG